MTFNRGGPLSFHAAAFITAGAIFGLGGCLEAGLLSDAAFPTRIAGLAPDQPWIGLPVGRWITESGVEPVAVAACFSPACEVQAVVARFAARGEDAARLVRIVDDPGRLAQELSASDRQLSASDRPAATRGTRPVVPVSPDRQAMVDVSRIGVGGGRGFLVRMSRADGSRPAYGAVVSAGTRAGIALLLVIAATEDGALRLAREVALREG